VLEPEQLLEALQSATCARDLPGMADVDFSLLQFCGDISRSVKVALSGECADEIFGGYPWFRDPDVLATRGFPWAQNTQQRAALLHPQWQLDPFEFVHSRYEQTLQETDILHGTPTAERQMKQMVNLNYRWFMQTLLDRKDRMSMHHSLEVRVPFCDHRIAEYLYAVPWEFKNYRGVEKGLLRYAMEGVLPKEILWRKKSPYPKTYDPQYMHLVSQALEQVLDRQDAPIYQIVNKQSLHDLLHAGCSCPWYGQLMQVPQTIAYMLQINFWLEEYGVEVV
jgi:asparagine synthase (glutamine-hydrolysing)